MSNPLLIKSFTAGAAIAAFRIVKFSATDVVIPGAAATDRLIGICGDVAPAINERCETVIFGIAYCEAGAAIAQGDMVTSDAVGRGITAAPAAGVNNRVIGVAWDAASAAGDVIRVSLEPGVMQG